jgi:hypothetical protein
MLEDFKYYNSYTHMKDLRKYLIQISQIGLMAAMLPELIKVLKDHREASHLSPIYLMLRILFFMMFGLGLYLKGDKELRLVFFASIFYIIVYSILLGIYYLDEKNEENQI